MAPHHCWLARGGAICRSTDKNNMTLWGTVAKFASRHGHAELLSCCRRDDLHKDYSRILFEDHRHLPRHFLLPRRQRCPTAPRTPSFAASSVHGQTTLDPNRPYTVSPASCQLALLTAAIPGRSAPPFGSLSIVQPKIIPTSRSAAGTTSGLPPPPPPPEFASEEETSNAAPLLVARRSVKIVRPNRFSLHR
jgi:hypothetical protein